MISELRSADPIATTPVGAQNLARRVLRYWLTAGPMHVPERARWPVALRRARKIGFVALGVQLMALMVWSHILTNRFALTRDYASWEQALVLLSHGWLDPYSTTLGHNFWHDHAEFIAWPIALLEALWRKPETASWAQDAAAVGSLAVAFAWICDIAANLGERGGSDRRSVALIALGAVILVSSPWVVWTCSYDVHVEAFATLFVMLTARDLHAGRRRAWLWWALGQAGGGDIGATYSVGVGLSMSMMGRRFAKNALPMAFGSLIWLFVLGKIHSSEGSPLGQYASVFGNNGALPQSGSGVTVAKAIVTHPINDVKALWVNHTNIWANVAPTGVIGWLWPPVAIPALIVLLEGGLTHGGMNFALPGFQNFTIVPLTAVGIIGIGAWVARGEFNKRRRLMRAIYALVLVNAVTWSAIWIPSALSTWLRVSPSAASVLKMARAKMAYGDEVAASQGVVGGFAGRKYIYPIMAPNVTIPAQTKTVWFVITPLQGIETAEASVSDADVAQLSETPGVSLVMQGAGVWVFEWHPQAGQTSLVLHGSRRVMPAWVDPGAGGVPVLEGPVSDWRLGSNGKTGYVLSRAYWREPGGFYQASVTLSSTSPTDVDVWDDTTNTLLSRQTVPATEGKTTITADVNVDSGQHDKMDDGPGIWQMGFIHSEGSSIEIRVWDAGGDADVSVYGTSLLKARG